LNQEEKSFCNAVLATVVVFEHVVVAIDVIDVDVVLCCSSLLLSHGRVANIITAEIII